MKPIAVGQEVRTRTGKVGEVVYLRGPVVEVEFLSVTSGRRYSQTFTPDELEATE